MKVAYYSSKGPARDVLVVGEQPDPAPQVGEVLVRIAHSGVNPSDVKSRSGVTSSAMEFPRVIPHSDGAGVVEAVGEGVSKHWIGQRVWTINGQWKRPFGTAAELIALPESQVAPLPDKVSTETGASLGIPLLTAWYAVHACGGLLGKTILVYGATGAVGGYATQLAALSGARVIGVAGSREKCQLASRLGAEWVINRNEQDVAASVREITDGQGVDAIIEVDAAANAGKYGEMLKFGGDVIIYGSGAGVIEVPFRSMIVGFVNLRFFIVYNLPIPVRKAAINVLTPLLERGALQHPKVEIFPLSEIAKAHERVESGANAKILVDTRK
ncbi:NADPH:quinone reductase [Paraburkholderia haematera]|uniref:Phthiocerol synthesis polyketide synthase type I PpsC n=1 Tax=Paraburkholderia haematera TaxID=2793077 RepID=A0ABN7MU55_9BURK|nr:NADPH:quinone reductase [Paraburkholderia haematera]CAE6813722.1 Phthiocerol synthesis polyketide synthase type I PpsC [Paraburkholderia haematera]